jgi:hypothetical protein
LSHCAIFGVEGCDCVVGVGVVDAADADLFSCCCSHNFMPLFRVAAPSFGCLFLFDGAKVQLLFDIRKFFRVFFAFFVYFLHFSAKNNKKPTFWVSFSGIVVGV